MSLRLLADQCVPRAFDTRLRLEGHEVVLLREVLPIRAADQTVIQKAQELDTVLLSLNGDFSDIVAYPPARYRGIIAIQLHNHPEVIPQLLDGLCRFLRNEPHHSWYAGKLVIVEPHRIRVRS